MIGYAMCGSFCTHKASLVELERIVSGGADVVPIMSEIVYTTSTRFGEASRLIERVEEICGRRVIHTIVDAEPLGPRSPLDILVVAPCTGNTLSKIARGVTDTAATMALKAHLRSDRPTLIALATNDAMSQNLANLAAVLSRKSVYFVPMLQDSPVGKPHSLVAEFELIPRAVEAMISGEQLRPIFLTASS